jgi:hypothetical protein
MISPVRARRRMVSPHLTITHSSAFLILDTPPPRKSAAPDTPSKRRKSAVGDDDEADKAFKADKVGSGRGGFSVKGAAAAAARARWAKVRLAKEERGEVDDDSKERKKGRVVRRENRAAVEKLKGESFTLSIYQMNEGRISRDTCANGRWRDIDDSRSRICGQER